MPRKKNSRAAQGAGNIRKKTVLRNGKEYTFWEARVTVGRDPGTGKQMRRESAHRMDSFIEGIQAKKQA